MSEDTEEDICEDLSSGTTYDVYQRNQDKLLNMTVKHPLVLKYPIRLSYQQHFLKKLISELEEKGLEVSDSIYNAYFRLLQESDDSLSHFRHFHLPNNKYVTLNERKCFISDGTTGLHSWQGAFALSEWLIKNHGSIEGKSVLELGSGSGLAGLTLLLVGKPYHYYFSDFHPEVLKQLNSNVTLNINNNTEPDSEKNKSPVKMNSHSDCELNDYNFEFVWNHWKSVLNVSDVKILNLKWELIENYELESVNPDIIIASDVVYDDTLFLPLCNVLEKFLKRKEVYALLVCTVRNESTLKQFIQLLESKKFSVVDEPVITSEHIPFSLETPIRYLKVVYVS